MARFAKPLVSSGYYSCNDNKPTIPYEGLSKFEYDPSEFSGLSIKQNTNNRYGSFSVGVSIFFTSCQLYKERKELMYFVIIGW